MSENGFLIAGLGNPGKEYENTRHNAGFWVLDALASRAGASFKSQKGFQGETVKTTHWGPVVHLLKPMTFMNLSGQSILAVLNFYKIDPTKGLLVISDEIDLPTGALRLKPKGGSAGHNGLKSIIEKLGHQEFMRLRFGVGKGRGETVDHVLGAVSKSEKPVIAEAVDRAVSSVEILLKDGIERAMEFANRRESADES